MSKISVNEKNLRALGVERLAKIVLSLVAHSSIDKRRLRYELAREFDPYILGKELKKRSDAWIKIQTTTISSKRVSSLLEEMTLHYSMINPLAAIDPHQAIEALFDMLHGLHNINQRKSYNVPKECYEQIAALKSDFQSLIIQLVNQNTPDPEFMSQNFLKRLPNHGTSYLPLLEGISQALGKEGLTVMATQISSLLEERQKSQKNTPVDYSKSYKDQELKEMLEIIPLLSGDTKSYLHQKLSSKERQDINKVARVIKNLSKVGLNKAAENCFAFFPQSLFAKSGAAGCEAHASLLMHLERKEEAKELLWNHILTEKNLHSVRLYISHCCPLEKDSDEFDFKKYKQDIDLICDALIKHFTLEEAARVCLFLGTECASTFDLLMLRRGSELSHYKDEIWSNLADSYFWEYKAPLGMLILCRQLIMQHLTHHKRWYRKEYDYMVDLLETCETLDDRVERNDQVTLVDHYNFMEQMDEINSSRAATIIGIYNEREDSW